MKAAGASLATVITLLLACILGLVLLTAPVVTASLDEAQTPPAGWSGQ